MGLAEGRRRCLRQEGCRHGQAASAPCGTAPPWPSSCTLGAAAQVPCRAASCSAAGELSCRSPLWEASRNLCFLQTRSLSVSFCLWEQGEHTCSAAGGAGAAPSLVFGVAICPAAQHGWVHAGIRSYLLCSELPLSICTRCGGHRGISHTTGSLFWGTEDAGWCPE